VAQVLKFDRVTPSFVKLLELCNKLGQTPDETDLREWSKEKMNQTIQVRGYDSPELEMEDRIARRRNRYLQLSQNLRKLLEQAKSCAKAFDALGKALDQVK
jgi:hypothetical protein